MEEAYEKLGRAANICRFRLRRLAQVLRAACPLQLTSTNDWGSGGEIFHCDFSRSRALAFPILKEGWTPTTFRFGCNPCNPNQLHFFTVPLVLPGYLNLDGPNHYPNNRSIDGFGWCFDCFGILQCRDLDKGAAITVPHQLTAGWIMGWCPLRSQHLGMPWGYDSLLHSLRAALQILHEMFGLPEMETKHYTWTVLQKHTWNIHVFLKRYSKHYKMSWTIDRTMPKKVKSSGIHFIDVHHCSPAMLRPLQCWSLGWGPFGSHRRILWRWQCERSRSDCTSALTSQGSRHVDTRRSPRCSNEKWISNDFNMSIVDFIVLA